MYAVWVIGFVWFALFLAFHVGLQSFPSNIDMLPKDIMSWTYIVVHAGQLFGINLMYLAWGYITAVNLLNFSNYLPADFFSSIKSLWSFRKQDGRRSSIVTYEQKNGAEINGLFSVHVAHSDGSESRYYIKREEFTFIVGIFRKFLRYVLTTMWGLLVIFFFLPYLGSGPLYLTALKTQFLIACEGSWFYSILLVQPFYPFANTTSYEQNDDNICFPYVG